MTASAVAGVTAGERFRSWPHIEANASRCAGGLAALGVREDDSVALMLRNDFATFEVNMAAGRLGVYAVPINWHFTPEEAGYILADSGAKVLVAHSDLLAQIASGVPANVKVVAVPAPEEIAHAYGVPAERRHVPDGVETWDDFLARSTPYVEPPMAARGSMIYTSGTTGRPKGVRRQPSSPEQLALAAGEIARYWGLKADPSIVVLMNGPMYHSAPAAYGMGSARLGLHVVLQARFDAEDMLRLIDRHKVSHMHIVPTMFVRLLRLPDDVKRRYDLSSLRWIVHGAAPCAPAVKRQMIDWWGPVITEYHGATETGVVVWHDSHEALRKPGTVGRVVEHAALRIVDEQGRDVKRGEVGEIYLRGPHFPEFTYNNDDAKRREIALGDLVTVGDVGYQDNDGYVFLCDRKRDMIISGGVNIYPAEIESVLIQMPGVRDCVVFGIPDEEFGEQICAYVEPAGGATINGAAVRAYLARHLARYKVPRLVELSAALPREDSGKIFKRKLRNPYWERRAGRSEPLPFAESARGGGDFYVEATRMSEEDVTLLGKLKTKLLDSKQKWAESGRLLTGKTAAPSQRLPPGQRQVENWPVLDLGIQPDIPTHAWRLFVDGEVESPETWKWGEFTDLPKSTLVTDIHCVTAWSRYDNKWEGVSARDLLKLVKPKATAQHVIFHSYDTYTTNVPLADFSADDVLLAWSWNGEPISREHGGPLRVVIPKLYFWKSAKWIKRIEFSVFDKPGFWEVRGYHNYGDPWLEQRYDDEQ